MIVAPLPKGRPPGRAAKAKAVAAKAVAEAVAAGPPAGAATTGLIRLADVGRRVRARIRRDGDGN